jgi:pantoate--beta-alanine ligase
MQIFREIASIQKFIIEQKTAGIKVGLVPTMGALHQGHISLVEKSLHQTSLTVVSIFVNPIQFNNPTDLRKYPQTFESDVALLEASGCHAVFKPSADEMYPFPVQLKMDFGELDKILEGKFRPGHFSGVGIVVAKLFNIIRPDVAYFGQKDYQQFRVIQKLIDDLSFPVELVGGEIIREPDGLAMSSRNKRLSAEARKTASVIFQSLLNAKKNLPEKKLEDVRIEVEKMLQQKGLRLEYLELADRRTLAVLQHFDANIPSVLLIAAYMGEVRLIDNMLV